MTDFLRILGRLFAYLAILFGGAGWLLEEP